MLKIYSKTKNLNGFSRSILKLVKQPKSQIFPPNETYIKRFYNNNNKNNKDDFESHGEGVLREEKSVLHRSRFGKKRYLTDKEILKDSEYPGELPNTFIPVMEAEMTDTKSRRAHEWLYSNFKEQYNWHRNRVYFDKNLPDQANGCWIAPNASVIGNVLINSCSSIWYNVVIRADLSNVTIGNHTNIQDGVIITTDDKTTIGGYHIGVQIGDNCSIGHGARLHACFIGHNVLIGMGATVLEGAIVENGAVVGAGAVVPPGRRIPKQELWVGNPCKFQRLVSGVELSTRDYLADHYYRLSVSHSLQWTSTGRLHKETQKILDKIESVLPEEEERPLPDWNVRERLKDFAQKDDHWDRQKYFEQLKRDPSLGRTVYFKPSSSTSSSTSLPPTSSNVESNNSSSSENNKK